MFDYVFYSDYRPGITSLDLTAEMSSSHDEDSNQLRTTAPQEKVRLVLQVKGLVVTTEAITKYLIQAMGAGKRRAIGRWLNASAHLTEEVMQVMDKRVMEK